MGEELRELNQLAAPPLGSEPSGPRDMSFEDKRRLSQQLGSLPGEVRSKTWHTCLRSAASAPAADFLQQQQLLTPDMALSLNQWAGVYISQRLLRVLEIVSKSSTLPLNDEGEAEVDIDALDNATLLELEEYVNGVLDVRIATVCTAAVFVCRLRTC